MITRVILPVSTRRSTPQTPAHKAMNRLRNGPGGGDPVRTRLLTTGLDRSETDLKPIS
jgi:hypothetical protein